MSFTTTSQNIRVEGTFLRGTLQDVEGQWRDAEYNLNEVLSNNDGHFEWVEPGTGRFGDSAENIRFSIEGVDGVPVLRATLRTVDGGSRDADVNLAERIINNNGFFHYN